MSQGYFYTFARMDKADLLLVGKVSRLHGFKGELSLKLDYDLPYDYESMDMLFIDQNGKAVPYFISSMRFTPKGFALVFLEGIEDEQSAKRLTGSELFLPKTEMDEMEEGAYLSHQLIGYEVVDEGHGSVGKIDDVIEHPGNVLLRITRIEGEVLIPLIDEFVVNVDQAKAIVHVKTPEGLIDLNLDDFG